MCTPPQNWVDYLQALLTPTIATVVALITYLQWRTNALRLKHDRFDRRFGMFEATRDFLSDLIKHGDLKEDARLAFLSATSGARFIFGKKIALYLDNIHSKACDLECVQSEKQNCDKPDVARLSKKRNNIMHGLLKDLKEIETTFDKYM